jgi:ribulose-phosphate 3-epimerase
VGVLMSPSVLDCDLTRLHDEISRVSDAADMIHLDVMDNHFVPNLTFGLPIVRKVISECSIPADCHLMIDDPERWAPEYAEAGAYSVTFHVEAATDPIRVARDIRAAGARCGVAVKPGTSANAIEDLIPFVDMVLVMTVEPGFGGQSFMADQMAKVSTIRSWVNKSGADIWVQVDGGVGPTTIEQCAEAGANVFVAGSAVYRAPDPAAMVTALRSMAELSSA